MICVHMGQNIAIFFAYEKKRKKRSKTCCFTTGFEIKKMNEERGGPIKKIGPPHTFSKSTHFLINSSLHNVRKTFEVFPKNFLLSQKHYLHTSVYTFVTPENYSDFLQNLEAKIQISREKKCA